ncbi:unnamed protein product [Rhizoctonia solani]|uniref:TPR and ankyrin repeat-containing protein 1 n=1 Tax=Rhizoctonia solani TaxID=456999 RepID=A0A8H3GF41_9AGAM|nr:unnamed protein product [Rhizoctonia solani]
MSMHTSWRWPVVLSGRAIRELRQLTEDNKTLEIIRTKFKELSRAQFTTDNYLIVRGTESQIPIYRARMSVDLRIIYMIDLVADSESKTHGKVIKIFSVSTRARLAYDFWVKVSRYLARLGREYKDRCTRREYVQTADGPLNIPAMFDHREFTLAGPDGEYSMDDEDNINSETDMNELHEIVALEKFSPVTKSLYNSILADMEAVLPMALNPDERKIVRHHGTSIVIGRSGTGKTTALIYKMRANAQLASRSDELRPTRQLFVTRSKVLTQHIARNYQGLLDSSDIANKTTNELEEMRKDNQKYQNRELVEYDNSVDFRVDLPRRFSELKDSHFPLFVSFDKLCELLEGDMMGATGEDALSSARMRSRPIITFSEFKHQYWPSFNSKLTRNLNPALVFSEILGVIKGYGRNLTMDEYLTELSHKKSPLLMNVRDRVYEIYEAFIDEVQDHLMSDVHLLQSLCSNVDGGYWCGDTAQTINVGSSFRIKDLKAFVYDSMIPKEPSGVQRKAAMPFSLFELTVNFRSHGGIVRYAASLVELIYTLFPTPIDVMAPETAKTPGLPPLLFVSSENNEASFVHYLLDQSYRSIANAEASEALHSLEFDDILLYNFFEESEAPTSAWRVILSLSVRNENGRVQFDKLEPHLTVSPVLCSELKQLYVAITRARHRCWIWDSGETINAMKVFWEGLKLIAGAETLASLSKFAASSKDLRQWAQRGQEFFSTGLYALAQSCFERAGQDKEAAIADAYNTMTEAKTVQGTGSKNALVHAARKMEACAKSEKSSHTASTLWYHAGTCWHGAREIVQASRAYCQGGFYDQAAVISFEAQNMDECLKILVSHSGRMDPALVHRIEEVASVHFLRERRYDDLQRLYKGDLDQCIALARSLRFPTQLKELLQRNRRFEDLSNEYLSDGLPVRAIECLLKVRKPSTVERAKKIVSSYLWMTFSLDATLNPQSAQQAEDLINVCESLGGFSDPAARHDIEIFSTLLRHQSVFLELFENILANLDSAVEEDKLRKNSTRDLVLPVDTADASIREALAEHVQQSLKELHARLLESPWTQPLCLPRYDHESNLPEHPSQLTRRSQELIQTLDLVFLALESAKNYGANVGATGFTKTEADKVQTAWIIRLFNVIFAPSGVIIRAGLEQLKPGSSGGILAWVEDAVLALDPNKHKQSFPTLLVIYLSISSELYLDHIQPRNLPLLRGRAPTGCLPKPDLFAADISTLHQPASFGRLYKAVDSIGIWSISLLAVNLHPTHPALLVIFSMLKDAATEEENRIQTPLKTELVNLAFNPNTLPVEFNQKLCFTLLTSTFHHDEVVMLLDNREIAYPVEQSLITQTIVFNDIPHLLAILGNKLNGATAESGPFVLPDLLPDPKDESGEMLPDSPLADTTPHHEDIYETPLDIPSSRPETPVSLPDSESQDVIEDKGEDEEAGLTPDDAARCIQTAWRRSVERQAQRRRLNEFGLEGRLYEEHRLNFPKMGKSATERDVLALRLVRGACLPIVLGLQMLVEEMKDYLEHIDDNLKGEGLTPKDVDGLQKLNKKNQKLVE